MYGFSDACLIEDQLELTGKRKYSHRQRVPDANTLWAGKHPATRKAAGNIEDVYVLAFANITDVRNSWCLIFLYFNQNNSARDHADRRQLTN